LREGLTQTELENQRFGFTAEHKIDIQLHAAVNVGKGRVILHGSDSTLRALSLNAASVSSASARLANTRL
jgi:hypothetical protein